MCPRNFQTWLNVMTGYDYGEIQISAWMSWKKDWTQNLPSSATNSLSLFFKAGLVLPLWSPLSHFLLCTLWTLSHLPLDMSPSSDCVIILILIHPHCKHLDSIVKSWTFLSSLEDHFNILIDEDARVWFGNVSEGFGKSWKVPEHSFPFEITIDRTEWIHTKRTRWIWQRGERTPLLQLNGLPNLWQVFYKSLAGLSTKISPRDYTVQPRDLQSYSLQPTAIQSTAYSLQPYSLQPTGL